MDSSNVNSSLVNLGGDSFNSLIDSDNLLSEDDGLSGQSSDDSLDEINSLGVFLDNNDVLVNNIDLSDLDDVDVDGLSDNSDFLSNVDDLRSENSDLLGILNSLGSILLDDFSVLVDLNVDLGDFSDEFNNLGNVIDDDNSGVFVILLDWSWLSANQVWSLVRFQLGSDKVEGLIAFSGDREFSDVLALLV